MSVFMRNRLQIDAREVFEKAATNPLETKDLESMSLHTRCKIIRNVVDVVSTSMQASASIVARTNLQRLSKSFPVSDAYYQWQDRGLNSFISTLRSRDNKALLDNLRSWDSLPQHLQENSLVQSCKLHQRSYMTGISDTLRVDHEFKDIPFRISSTTGKRSIILGLFKGNLRARKATITQNNNPTFDFTNAEFALDTAHHEMTHAIHFSLALAFSNRTIRQDHPLYKEAEYFHAINRYDAIVPSNITGPYEAQTHEHLAETQGNSLSRAIMELTYS
ncbi:MAG: hypothetical protein AAF204_02530 [Pseudomonadota bacterium]